MFFPPALAKLLLLLLSIGTPNVLLAMDGMERLFEQEQTSTKQLHFYYDQDGFFTVNGGGISEEQSKAGREMGSPLLLRRMGCDGNEPLDVRIRFCAPREPSPECGNGTGGEGDSLSLLLCYQSHLNAPHLVEKLFQIPPVPGHPLGTRCAKRSPEGEEEETSGTGEKLTWKPQLAGLHTEAGEGEVPAFDFGHLEGGADPAIWNGLEVRLDIPAGTFELAASLFPKSYKFDLPEDKCFELQMLHEGIGQPKVEIVDSQGSPIRPRKENLESAAFDGEMPAEMENATLKSGQFLADFVDGQRGIWLLPWDFLPRARSSDRTFQKGEFVKMGRSVHKCVLRLHPPLHPVEVVERRGQWNLLRYESFYGQKGGNESAYAKEYCAICEGAPKKRAAECEGCKRLKAHLARINKSVQQTQGFVDHFHENRFVADYLLMAREAQKEPFTALGREGELGGNVLHQFWAECAGLEFALPIHN